MDPALIKTPHDVTPAMIGRVLLDLLGPGIHHMTIDEGYSAKRVVLATMPNEREIMIAMEGSGCIFIDRHTNINPFVFVTAGFQLTAAQIITKVIVGFADARAEVDRQNEVRYPQLTHQNRS